MSKKVSACYITRQAEDFLFQSMRSVYDFVDEIIVVDDMSTDNTVEIVKSFPESKVILVRGNYKRNKARQRNNYLNRASGQWIMVIDDDEVYMEEQLDWLGRFIVSPKGKKLTHIYFKMIWFWKNPYQIIHGHHWDQWFETFYKNQPGLRYDVHHYVNLNNRPYAKQGASHRTEKVKIYHYSHCKPDKKVEEKLRYYMLRDNPNVNKSNVDLFVKRHPHFSNNFNYPRFGPQGLQVAGTVGKMRDFLKPYGERHPRVMEGHPIFLEGGAKLMDKYKKRINSYMENVWQFHNHLHHERHQNRIKYTAEFLRGRSVEIGCASGISTNTMIQHLKNINRKGVSLEAVEPTDWGYAEAVRTNPHIKFTKAMGEDLPFEDGEFDTVLCAEVVEHVLNPHLFLKECSRICKKGGRLIVTFPNGVHPDPDHQHVFSPVSATKLLEPFAEKTRIYGLTIDGKRCTDLRNIYFMIIVSTRK
jgi:glycosyltransferase involved in cell wall biosynthesis